MNLGATSGSRLNIVPRGNFESSCESTLKPLPVIADRIGKGRRLSHRLIIFVTAITVVGVLVGLYAYQSMQPHYSTEGVKFQTLSGDELSLEELKGKVVLLEFMSTSCPVCANQVQYLQDVSAKYSGDQTVILSISIDPVDTVSILESYAFDRGLTWTLTKDTWLTGVMAFEVRDLPTIVIVDKEGVVRNILTGLVPSNALEDLLNQAMQT